MKMCLKSSPEPDQPFKGYVRLIAYKAALILLVLLFAPGSALADMAPPSSPPGSNPIPGNEGTQVRMVSETVTIDVQKKNSSSKWLGQAKVTAEFQMRNLGSSQERMEARFPLTFWNGWSDGFGNFPEIDDLQVRVNGSSAPTRRITTPNPDDPDSNPIPWAAFLVTFPPDEAVQVEVTYTADGFGEYPYVVFQYVLETGAGWKESIGSADLIVRLPYEASKQNVIFDHTTGFAVTTPGAQFRGKELRWHFENLEPGPEDNLEIALVMPEAWQKVLAERDNIAKDPKDGEAWGRLGKAYKEAARLRRGMREDEGGLELTRLSIEAYEQAVTLRPKDALWHYGFADLLWTHYYYNTRDISELLRLVQELKTSLEIDPDNVLALELLEEVSIYFPEAVAQTESGFDYLILTATPAISTETPLLTEGVEETAAIPPSPTATTHPQIVVGVASDTPPPPASATPVLAAPTQPAATAAARVGEEKPAQRTGLPFCGAALIFPMAAVLLLNQKTRRK